MIKKEINPTLRLKKEDLQYYEKHKLIIYSIRILFLSVIMGIIYLSYPYYVNPIFYTLGGISLLYIIHNNIGLDNSFKENVSELLKKSTKIGRYRIESLNSQYGIILW